MDEKKYIYRNHKNEVVTVKKRRQWLLINGLRGGGVGFFYFHTYL